MSDSPIGIVGGGIVGLAVGRELTLRYPGVEVQVFEKEDELASHQTGNNSGVVHAGIYYQPGSLKAQLCTRGRVLLREFCLERDLPYDEVGKLVVAVDPSEMGRLDALERTARENQVPGLRRVDGREINEIEPHAEGIAALHSPATAITDFAAVARAYASDIEAAGGTIRLSTEVTRINVSAGSIELTTGAATHRVGRLVICAGLQADRVSAPVDGEPSPRIVPFRGEYMDISPAKRDLVRGLIYPVPDPRYPFLGVHFTRRVSGVVDVGPNAVLALDREGYRRSDVRLADVANYATWPGFWRMARTHWRTGIKEVRGSLSIRSYMQEASRYVPEIGAADVERGGVGIRAQALDRDGSLVDDFRINETNGVVSVRNAPSPAATSSLAIAEHVVDRMTQS
ncbi:L-2-hydroxyglutarate oxidase [Ilumatobacter nonamiensis]|uniref:L-2-hydroxyglutarate oxidase n=1 Tax=Ilumatobacter nonamiensis TaxID=467093 RepID=UPI00058DAC5D|nr:L-2-hydroxyglutarate oxidase [Ilumatobacter nonamiensis]